MNIEKRIQNIKTKFGYSKRKKIAKLFKSIQDAKMKSKIIDQCEWYRGIMIQFKKKIKQTNKKNV